MSDPTPAEPTATYPIAWDKTGEHLFETGVDHGVLYLPDSAGNYNDGVAWNGLTTITESPEGAEGEKQYADNIAYLTLVSAEEWKGSIAAFTYPEEFGVCDGTAAPVPGLQIGQQSRKPFGLCYRTKVGNDTVGQDFGYKLHLAYGLTASPSEKEYATINDSPEAIEFSWDFTSNPVAVPGMSPASLITVDSTKVSKEKITALEEVLYGKGSTAPKLPLPAEVLSLLGA